MKTNADQNEERLILTSEQDSLFFTLVWKVMFDFIYEAKIRDVDSSFGKKNILYHLPASKDFKEDE